MRPEIQSPPGLFTLKRILIVTIVVLLVAGASIAAYLLLRPRTYVPAIPQEYPDEAAFRMMSSNSVALRKKLELPFALNFTDVDLSKVLKWIEAQLDIEFRMHVDSSALSNVTVQSNNRPLIETLCDVLSRRNMGLVLQRDAAVIVPCTQAVKTSVQGESRLVSFTMETEIACELEEPIELYCGDRGQYRIHLLAHVQTATENYSITQRSMLVSLYVDRELKAFSEVEAVDDEWTEVPFPVIRGVSLKLKPSEGEESALVLGITFVYTQAEPI